MTGFSPGKSLGITMQLSDSHPNHDFLDSVVLR